MTDRAPRGFRKHSAEYRDSLITLLLLCGFKTFTSAKAQPSKGFRRVNPLFTVVIFTHRTELCLHTLGGVREFKGIHKDALDWFKAREKELQANDP